MPSLPKGCPITLVLIAINIVLFAGQFATQDGLTNFGLLFGPAVSQGEYWRIIASGFLHGSILHIGFNMYLLYLLGPELERNLGSTRFIMLYIGSLLGGALAVLMFNFNQPTLGASGAVLGLAGAMFVALWGRGVSPRQSPAFGLVVINLALPLLVPGISFWGHFGGVAAGALLAFVTVWLPDKGYTKTASAILSQGLGIIVLLGVACLIVV
jgi:membrane associated rhomboid family serine protease